MKWLVVLIMPIVLMAADPALRSIIVSQDGKMVTLDDNTTYEIAPRDQNIAFGWIGGAQVRLGKDAKNSQYPITFTDTQGNVVHAREYEPEPEAPSEDDESD